MESENLTKGNCNASLLDTDAYNKAIDADAALQELGSDAIGQTFVTATVTVWDDDISVADEKLRLVEKVIQGRNFTCMAESVNAVEAWLGSLPGLSMPTSANHRFPRSTLRIWFRCRRSGQVPRETCIFARRHCSRRTRKGPPRFGFRCMSATSAIRWW